MPVRKQTVRKVKEVLQDLKNSCESQDVTNLRKYIDFYGLSGGHYSPVLRAMEVVKKDPETRTYIWNAGKPGKKLAKEVAKVVFEYGAH